MSALFSSGCALLNYLTERGGGEGGRLVSCSWRLLSQPY